MTSTTVLCARALVLPTALAALGAVAQQGVPPLERVVVTASRSDALLEDMPLHTTVISGQDLQASPAQTLDQVLRNVPGLLIPGAPAATADPTGANIKFRGMDKKVLVLVDGMPVLDPFYSTIQWFKLPLSSIARVEVVRGGGSSLWGNLAVGGVINIVSKRPNANDGDASISYGSMNTWTAALSQNLMLSESLRLNLAVDGFKTGGYDNFPAAFRARFWPGRAASSATAKNLRLGAFFDPSEDLTGFVRIGYHEQSEDIGGYAFGTNLQRSPDVQAGVTRRLGTNGSVSADAYAQRVHFDKYNGAGCYAAPTYACGASVPGRGASDAQQRSPTLQYASSYDLNTYRERGGSIVYSRGASGPLAQWQVGLDYRAIAGADAQQSYRTPTNAMPAALRLQRGNDGSGQQRFIGVFSQLKWTPIDPLALTLGARLDRFGSADGVATQTNYSDTAVPVAASASGGAVPNLTKTAFDPSLSARYEIDPQLDLRGSVYKAFRAPGLNNLYRSFGSSSITIANPLLGPETLVGKEIGIDWREGDTALGATWFQADVRNVVATYAITPGAPIPAAVQNICGTDYTGASSASCPGSVAFYTNGQDQRATGIEVDGRWSVSRALTLSAYATETHTVYTRTATGDPIKTQLPLVPKYVAGASLSWRNGSRWTSVVDLRYNGSMTLSNLTVAPAVRQGAYTVVNAGMQFKIDARLELFGSIVNAFDRRYTDASANNPQSIAYAMPRAATIGVRAHW